MNKVFIIAEAGVNHNKGLDIAFALVDAAKKAGADAVKFQTYIAEKCISRYASMAEYQRKRIGKGKTQFEMAKELELTFDDFRKIKKHCDDIGILFLSTPDEEESLDFLCSLGMPLIKIGAAEMTNHPFLDIVARKKKPIILSTGMSTVPEIKDAIKAIYKAGNKNISLLHCVTEYPAPIDQINLSAIKTMSKEFNVPVGYSDHTVGIEASIAAVAIGARIIEKHFTIDKIMKGPDHGCSLNPAELAAMILAIRNVEKAMGTGIKMPAKCETKNLAVVRKSIVTARNIKKGEKLTCEDIAIKKPGNGIEPFNYDIVLGKIVKRNIKADKVLFWKDLK